MWTSCEQRANRYRGFDPGEGRTETEVDAHAECDMPVRLAGDVEGVRIGELVGVAVRGGEHLENEVAFPELLSAQLAVFPDPPRVAFQRTFKPQHLFDCRRHQRGFIS